MTPYEAKAEWESESWQKKGIPFEAKPRKISESRQENAAKPGGEIPAGRLVQQTAGFTGPLPLLYLKSRSLQVEFLLFLEIKSGRIRYGLDEKIGGVLHLFQ